MATMKEMVILVNQFVSAGKLDRYTSLDDLIALYRKEVATMELDVVGYNGKMSKRKWGKGGRSNENLEDFIRHATYVIFQCSGSWPTATERKVRDNMVRLSLDVDSYLLYAAIVKKYPDAEDVYNQAKQQLKSLTFKGFLKIAEYVEVTEVLKIPGNHCVAEIMGLVNYYALGHFRDIILTPQQITNGIRILIATNMAVHHIMSHALYDYTVEDLDNMFTNEHGNLVTKIRNKNIPEAYITRWQNCDGITEEIRHKLNTLEKFTANKMFDLINNKSVQAALYAGMAPKQLVNHGFSKKEAHAILFNPMFAWRQHELSEIRSAMKFYISRKYQIDSADLSSLRDVSGVVLQWLILKYHNSKMHKVRTRYGANEERITFTYVNLLDEILAEDLVNGMRTDPDIAFAQSQDRIEKSWLADMGENVDLPAGPAPDTKQIVQIKTSNALLEEGRLMKHCVGGYVKACVRGDSFIYHVCVNDKHSTLEISKRDGVWRLIQHAATKNVKPANNNIEAVNAWCIEHKITLRK